MSRWHDPCDECYHAHLVCLYDGMMATWMDPRQERAARKRKTTVQRTKNLADARAALAEDQGLEGVRRLSVLPPVKVTEGELRRLSQPLCHFNESEEETGHLLMQSADANGTNKIDRRRTRYVHKKASVELQRSRLKEIGVAEQNQRHLRSKRTNSKMQDANPRQREGQSQKSRWPREFGRRLRGAIDRGGRRRRLAPLALAPTKGSATAALRAPVV